MEIKYQLTPRLVEDAKAELMTHPNRYFNRILFLSDQSVILFILIILADLFGGTQKPVYWFATYFLLNVIYFVLIRPKRLRGLTVYTENTRYSSPGISEGFRLVKITQEEISLKGEDVLMQFKIKTIYQVNKLKECLYITGGLGEGLIISIFIPYSAFASKDEIEEACALLGSKNSVETGTKN
jgi:hypothetical protein